MLAFVAVLINLSCEDLPRENVYLQRKVPTTLDVIVGHTILFVKSILPSGILLLEGKIGQKCREHSKNCAPCHHLMEGTLHPELAVMLEGLLCFVCGEKEGVTTILLCDKCQLGWHMTCLTLSLISLLSGDWIRPQCRRSLGHDTSADTC